MATTINPSDQTITQYNIQTGGASNLLNNVAPSATSGVPVISQGAASQPIFGTALVAGGGTGQTTLTNHGVLVGAATAAITQLSAGSAGQVLQSGGASADPAYSTATYPATAGTSGNIITSNGTNFVSSSPSSLFTPNSTLQMSDDFLPNATATNLFGQLPWLINGNSVWTPVDGVATSARPGVVGNNAGTAASIKSLSLMANNGAPGGMIIGGGQITVNWVFNIVTASNGTNRYDIAFGLGDTIASTTEANGAWFHYSDNLNSGNWVINTSNASTPTNTNTSTSASVGWHNAQIIINAAGTSIQFLMDGVSLGTITTNLPATGIFPLFVLSITVGTVALGAIYIDLFYMTQILTTAR